VNSYLSSIVIAILFLRVTPDLWKKYGEDNLICGIWTHGFASIRPQAFVLAYAKKSNSAERQEL
jgi:hypothetical protein